MISQDVTFCTPSCHILMRLCNPTVAGVPAGRSRHGGRSTGIPAGGCYNNPDVTERSFEAMENGGQVPM